MKAQQYSPVNSYSVYDLNMAKTLNEDLPFALQNELVTNPRFDAEHFRAQVWKSVEFYCRDNGLSYDHLLKSPPAIPIIIDSASNRYFHLLEIALMFYDPFLIKHFLTYQYKNFKGNKDASDKLAFLGQLMFLVYDNIKLNSHNLNLHRKEKIIDWLEENGALNLPERFSKRANPEDTRLKGKLTPNQISPVWMQLTSYKVPKGIVVEVLHEGEINQFLHANFWGFNPPSAIQKLDPRNINQTEFRRFCYRFFNNFSESNRSRPFIKMLKNNFSIFDSTSEDSLASNFSK